MASSYVLTETSKKGERKAKKSMINPKHPPARIHSFIHLMTQKTRHAQTLVHECFAFSTHPCVFQPRFYESSDGEFISAGRCFDKGKREEKSVRFAFSAHPVPPALLFRILYGVFICFDRNFIIKLCKSEYETS